MSISPITAEWAVAYEKEYGHQPSERALQMAEHINKLSVILQNLGQRDAQKGDLPYSADIFQELAKKAFCLDPDKDHEIVQVVADLWQADYMDGYRQVTMCD